MPEDRNIWDWAYEHGGQILTGAVSLIVGAIVWVSWVSFKIETIDKKVTESDAKHEARFEKWEERLWNEENPRRARPAAVSVANP